MLVGKYHDRLVSKVIRKGAMRKDHVCVEFAIVWLIMELILIPSQEIPLVKCISVANAPIQSLCPEFVVQEILRKAGHDVLVTSGGPDIPGSRM